MASTQIQKCGTYNRFLPYAGQVESEASRYLQEIKTELARSLDHGSGQLKLGLKSWTTPLHKFITLYDLQFPKEDHVHFIQVAYESFCLPDMDPVTLNDISQLLIVLLKKKFLLSRDDLELPWKPLFDLYYHYEDSSWAARAMVKPHVGLKGQIRKVIKHSRSYFPKNATREMVDLWMPLLCPYDRSISLAMGYFNTFLPTTCDLPSNVTYELWFDELMKHWNAFTNAPSWETDLFQLFSRLTFHNVGRIDWEPYIEMIFSRIMNSFALPCTYGGSGIKLKFGLASSNSTLITARWIVYAMEGGRGLVQKYLHKMLMAIESYYQPTNTSSCSDVLHSFISSLCTMFVQRVHLERFNKKWVSKTPMDKRLHDSDITTFVTSLKPIAFLILFGTYEEEKRNVFNVLSTLRPKLMIPDLLTNLRDAFESLTEPHRFSACITALSASARPFVENFPTEVVDTLTLLLPGIDVNDVWKFADNFILMSEFLEMIWLVDFSNPSTRPKDHQNLSEEEQQLLSKTSQFEDFVIEFLDKCFVLIQNSKREQTRHDTEVSEDYLNDEELAVEAAIGETFNKIMLRCSPQIFNLAFDKLKRFVQDGIFEVSVAGSILAGMCKSVVTINPEMTLDFFVPHLCRRINTALMDRVDAKRADVELQFSTLLLSEVVSVRGISFFVEGGGYLLKHLDSIMGVLDKTLKLESKDEYEYASGVLSGLLSNLVHVRPLQKSIAQTEKEYDSEKFKWAKCGDIETLTVNWYIPSEFEMEAAQMLVTKYLSEPISDLEMFVKGQKNMEKEDVVRNLRQMYKVVYGCSEVLEPISCVNKGYAKPSVMREALGDLKQLGLSLQGRPVRQVVMDVLVNVQNHLLSSTPDDTDSLTAVVNLYDLLLRHFGGDEEDLYDILEEYKTLKHHRENRMIKSKKHYESVLIDRIASQHRAFLWLKNIIDISTLPLVLLEKIFELCISHYSEVRVAGQELLQKILGRTVPFGQELVIPMIVKCLQNSPEITHQMLKGALYVVACYERYGFFYSWKMMLDLVPAIIQAQHSDKESVVDLLKEIGIKTNRSYSDFSLYTMPIKIPVASPKLKQLITGEESMETEDEINLSSQIDPNFLILEKTLVNLVASKTLHWRHEQMAIGLMLLLVTKDYVPRVETVEVWLRNLVHEDRNVRLISTQALECIFKLLKRKKKRFVLEESIETPIPSKPGLREDNEWMQYKVMNDKELEEYWNKPFTVKPHMGFHSYKKPLTLRLADKEDENESEQESNPVIAKLREYFFNLDFVNKFMEINTIEHKKGEDFFKMDNALLQCAIFECFGESLLPIFLPHIDRLAVSNEESDQRMAAEIVHGVIRGSRFWSLKATQKMWDKVSVIMTNVLQKATSETIGDWETCLNGATNKHDPNRLRWLFELFMKDGSQLINVKGAFQESTFLQLLNKSISQNFKVRDLYQRVYDMLKDNVDHPYVKVRSEISRMLSQLLSFDVFYDNGKWNIGKGFPKIAQFIDEVIPKLSLNMHNPEINGHLNGDLMDQGDETNDSTSGESTPASRTLQTVSKFVVNHIQSTSANITADYFKLLPYFCQFVGTEMNKDESQDCLKALCYISVSVVPQNVIPSVLEMITKLQASLSWKTKLSMLEFIQVFIFTNFMQLCNKDTYVSQVKEIVLNMLSDLQLQVQQRAAKVLGGLIHSQFFNVNEQEILVKSFRAKIRTKMHRKNKDKLKFKKENIAENKEKLAKYHSGVLGLCAFVEAYPFDVPKFVPGILVELEKHLHDPQPIPKTIKKSFQEFKRTHQDKWEEHKLKFTEDQLLIMNDLLISPNYYA